MNDVLLISLFLTWSLFEKLGSQYLQNVPNTGSADAGHTPKAFIINMHTMYSNKFFMMLMKETLLISYGIVGPGLPKPSGLVN